MNMEICHGNIMEIWLLVESSVLLSDKLLSSTDDSELENEAKDRKSAVI